MIEYFPALLFILLPFIAVFSYEFLDEFEFLILMFCMIFIFSIFIFI